MKKIHIISLAWAIALASCSLQTQTDDFFACVRGSVVSPTDCAVTLTLTCLDDPDVKAQTLEPDKTGSFVFDRVENGQYKLTAFCSSSVEKTLSQRLTVMSKAITLEPFVFTASSSEQNSQESHLSLRSDFEMTLTKDASLAVSRAVTVTIICHSKEHISRLCYSAGNHSEEFFESGYGTSVLCVAQTASVQLIQNAVYTFYAKTSDGLVSMAQVEIDCIDTEAPQAVSNVRAAFSTQSGKLEVQWESSSSEDVHSLEVLCSGNSGEQKLIVPASKTACAFSCIPDGSTYTISICALDLAGNKSRVVTQSVVVNTEPAVYRAWLDRSRVALGDGTKEMVLFVQGCNFGQAEEGLFVVQLDSYDTIPHVLEITDATSAFCSFVIPTKKGNYTASVIYNDLLLATTTFEVCDSPCVNEVMLSKTQVPAGSAHSVTARILGTGLDLCTDVRLSLLLDNEVVLEKKASPLSTTSYECTFETPVEEADYTLSVTVDSVQQDITSLLQVYGTISITSVDEAYAPLCNCGKEIELIVRGKNLNVEEDALTVVCNGKTYKPYKIESSLCYVKVFIPVSACARDIDISVCVNGTESETKGVLKVLELRDYIDSQFALLPVADKTVTLSKAGSSLLKQNTQIAAFALGKYVVTQGLWYEVFAWAKEHGYTFTKEYTAQNISSLLPCTDVSWREAVVWCNAFTEWHNAHLKDGESAFTCVYYEDSNCTKIVRTVSGDLTLMTDSGKSDNPVVKKSANGYRLPSAAEWEYAFRGANTSASDWDFSYAGSTNLQTVAWYSANSGKVLHECGKKKTNALGLYDMSGGVWEWMSDWAISNVTRRLRGGSYKSSEEECSAACDGSAKIPYLSDGTSGFRLARNK